MSIKVLVSNKYSQPPSGIPNDVGYEMIWEMHVTRDPPPRPARRRESESDVPDPARPGRRSLCPLLVVEMMLGFPHGAIADRNLRMSSFVVLPCRRQSASGVEQTGSVRAVLCGVQSPNKKRFFLSAISAGGWGGANRPLAGWQQPSPVPVHTHPTFPRHPPIPASRSLV